MGHVLHGELLKVIDLIKVLVALLKDISVSFDDRIDDTLVRLNGIFEHVSQIIELTF